MYLRTRTRKNKDGTIAEYYQLAHNEHRPNSKRSVARVVYNFGRANRRVRDELVRLCRSIAEVCGLIVVDPRVATKPSRTATETEHGLAARTEPKSKIQKNSTTAEMPTNEELMQQVNALEEKITELQKSEIKYKSLFKHASDEIIFTDIDGRISEVNERVEDIFGLKREEVIGKNFFDLGFLNPKEMRGMAQRFQKALIDKDLNMIDHKIRRKDGTVAYIEVSPNLLDQDGELKGFIAVIRDVTARKQAEEELSKYRDHLQELVKDRTADLEEANIALKLMLKKENEIKKEFEEKILFNVKDLILPNLEKLNSGKLNDRQKAFLNIVKSNLNDILSPFSHKLSSRYFNLTPMELHIANLIKHGKSTIEVAELTDVSVNTTQFHRANIRKKVGLKNRKQNLRSYLQTLQD